MKCGYVDTPDGQVHYRIDGTGSPLLLLHQTPSSSDEYSRVIPALSATHRVVALDLLGHGNSAVPPAEYGIEEYARNAWHFLDALEIQNASIVGHHTGALVAIEMAVTHPGRVDKLVLSGCLCWDDIERQAQLEDFLRRTPSFPADGSLPYAFVELWENQRSFCLPGASPEVWLPAYATGCKMGVRLHHGHAVACRYDVLRRLPSLRLPTLLLFGTRDHFTTKYQGLAKSLIHDSRVRVLENAGVFVALEMPSAFAEAILEFL